MDEDDDYEYPVGLGCALEMFREKEEVFGILQDLPKTIMDGTVEIVFQLFEKLVNRYQEQPHLLDKDIEGMIEICLRPLQKKDGDPELIHVNLKFLRHIFKVRGPKEIIKRMPHEISDLVPVLEKLEEYNFQNSDNWETAYILFFWLSILVLNPFHLKLLDGNESKSGKVSFRLMKLCTKSIELSVTSFAKGSSMFIAKFLTRPDMLELYMEKFIQDLCDNLVKSKQKSPIKLGTLCALSSIFKHGKRQEILKYGQKVLAALHKSNFGKEDTLIRKEGTKLIQRIGLIFMKTKIAPWRYQRGSRSLLTNMKIERNQLPSVEIKEVAEESYDDIEEFSSDIESIIDILLESLKDKENVVRWSAAKGIGRITNKLPKEYADEVVESILANFTDREGNGAWQGGCLAIAELGRRGLLLPERLPQVIPHIKKALIYDEIRGNFSVGSHVRDAACYVLWAFARAFEPQVVEPYVNDIATALITTMVFDREVNCRRAASAAFQENVGRQGNYPHGIDIITIADYFALGVRNTAFAEISVEIAKFPEYTKALIDHLVENKYSHYDLIVRELTAKALANLTPLDPTYVLNVCLEKLLPLVDSSDIYKSHGSIICISAVIVKLKEIGKLNLSEKKMNDIRQVIPRLFPQFRQPRVSELLRRAVIVYIHSASIAKLPFHDDIDLLNGWHNLLEDNITNCDPDVKNKTIEAMPPFLYEYYYLNSSNIDKLPGYIKELSNNLYRPQMAMRTGYGLTLGKFPLELLRQDFESVMKALLHCATIDPDTTNWAESRSDATKSIGTILAKNKFTLSDDWNLGIPIGQLPYEEIYKVLLKGLNDYSQDKRGDIGSWVREASMTSLMYLTFRLHEQDHDGSRGLLNPSTMQKMMGLIMKQNVEQIDNTRVHAGVVFSTIVHKEPHINSIPKADMMRQVLTKEFCTGVNWRASAKTYPKFIEFLATDEYGYDVLTGLVVSGGSLSDSVKKHANDAMNEYLKPLLDNLHELNRISSLFIRIFKDYEKIDRVSIPLMKWLTQILQSGNFMPLLTPEETYTFGNDLINSVKKELARASRVEKLVAGIELLCETIQGSFALGRTALRKLMMYLGHTFPRIRVLTAEKIYEALLTYGDNLEMDHNQLDSVMTLLSETRWDGDLNKVRPTRNYVCELLNVPVPVAVDILGRT